MRGKNLTYEQISELIYLYENNIPVTDIAEYFSKHLATIHRVIWKTKAKRKSIKVLLKEHEESHPLT